MKQINKIKSAGKCIWLVLEEHNQSTKNSSYQVELLITENQGSHPTVKEAYMYLKLFILLSMSSLG